jgi:non-specific serine/threonine protein kinase
VQDVLGLLTGLVDKSLVIAEEHHGRMRYRLLETIREYASERVQASGQAKEGCLRHATYYRDLAAAGASTRLGVSYPRDIEVVTEELTNVRAALGAMLSQGELQQGAELCLALGGFWLSQGHLNVGLEWLEGILKHEEALAWDTLADCLHTAGRIMEYRGALSQAGDLYQRSLTIARSHDDATRAARAVGGLGDVAIHQGEYERAVACLDEALSLGRAVGSLPEVTQALWSLARVAHAQGDTQRIRELCEEALLIQRRLGDRWGVAYSLHELGQLARREGQLDRAQALDEESHVLWRQSGSRMGERAALMSLAVVAFERGSADRAAALTLQILDLCREMVDPSATTVRCVEIAADVLLTVGSAEPAVQLIAAATTQRAALGAPVPPHEQLERDRALTTARAALATVGFERAWVDGGRLSTLEAVELAAESLLPFVVSGPP